MKRLLIVSLLFTSLFSIAQPQPVVFEPALISNNGVFGFTLSPNGKEAFWVQSNGGRDTLYIMHSVKIRGKWKTPTVASFSTSTASWKDIDPVFAPDGNTVLFQSTRPVPGKPDRKGFDIWAARRVRDSWSEPYHLGNVINGETSESYASMAKNGNIYFMKENPDGKGSSDIYVSIYVNGNYLEPQNIGSPINTSFRESNPFISPDEDYIIYFSSDSNGFGDVDLVISYRIGERWSEPVNLGSAINTAIGEFCPFYHPKEKRLYFSRTTQAASGRRQENIWWVSFDPKGLRNPK